MRYVKRLAYFEFLPGARIIYTALEKLLWQLW